MTALLFVSVELVCLGINRARGVRAPFLLDLERIARRFDPSKGESRGTGASLDDFAEYSRLDPHLGYAHDLEALEGAASGSIPGFVVHGDADDTDALRIVTLGGSTTDGTLFGGNWPRRLADELRQRGIAATVFNGGVGSFSTNQELLKLLRDALPLRPHLVMSYSGANEVEFDPDHPMVHRYQRALMNALAETRGSTVLPNTYAAITRARRMSRFRGVNYGPTVGATSAEQWERNVRCMDALTKEFDVRFLAILQPVLGVGVYEPTPREEEVIQTNGYCQQYPGFYAEAAPVAERLSCATSFADLFRGESDLFLDDCHLDDRGNAIVAAAVLLELTERDLLAPIWTKDSED